MEELKGRIIVYSIVGCPHCMRAKNTLHEHGLPYSDISLEVYPQCRAEVAQRTGKKTVPQIFFNNTHIGGNEELQKLLGDKEKWQKLVDEVRNNEPPADGPVPPDPSTAVKESDPDGFTCELDEYAQLVKEIENSGIIRDHRKGLKTYKQSFTGKDFIDWVEKTKELDRERGREMGQELINQHFGHNVKSAEIFEDSSDVFYRLLQDDESNALNAGSTSECEPRPVGELGEEIRKLILKIYNAFLSPDGKKVNYSGIAQSSEFKRYIRLTQELHRVNVESATIEEKLSFFINIYNALVVHANVVRGPPVNLWQRYKKVNYSGIAQSSEFKRYIRLTQELHRVNVESATIEEKLSFFINIYNALVVHANVVRGPPVNLWQRYKFFNTVRYIIGGYTYSLQDIENGVLRGNRKGVGMLFRPFSKTDPRLRVALKEHEPLVHFALVCGAKSCPPIKTYSAEGIYEQLSVATEAFVEGTDGCTVDMARKEVKLSMIFKWYRVDFGRNDNEVVEWIEKHMGDGEKRNNLKELLTASGYKVKHLPYDWGVNSN